MELVPFRDASFGQWSYKFTVILSIILYRYWIVREDWSMRLNWDGLILKILILNNISIIREFKMEI